MAKQTINIGSAANDGTGDPLRTAFDKINDNFDELYGSSAEANDLLEDTSPQLGGNLDINGFNITSSRSNEDIKILPAGTGGVLASSIRFAGTTISSDDSTVININEGLVVDGTASVSGATTLTGAVTASSTLAVTGASTLTGALTVNNSVTANSLTTNTIASNGSNADLSIQPSGTGDVLISALRVNGTTLDSSDSTKVTIAEAVDITGALTAASTVAVTGAATLSSTLAVTGTSTFSDGVTAESIITNSVTSNGSNADLSLQPSGTGDVLISALRVNGTTLDSSDSTKVTIAEAVDVTGAFDVAGATTVAAITASGTATFDGAVAFNAAIGIGDLNILADGTLTSDSNGDIVIDPAGTGDIVLTGDVTSTGNIRNTGYIQSDNLRLNGNTISALDSNGSININPNGTGSVVLGGEIVGVTNELNATDIEVSNVLRANKIQSDTSDTDITISSQGTGAVAISSQLTLTGSFKPAIHTFTATDAITEIEHAGRTLLLGEVGGNANVVLTLPDATGSGNIYHFIVSVAMGGSTTYKIQVADADNTIAGQIMYLDEDGTAVTSFPTVAASDTVTLNSGTQGGLVGDTLTLIDIATDKYAVFGQMRVSAGANPATPFSAAVS
jgi:hypothetical protein